jgi:hypothetical protein
MIWTRKLKGRAFRHRLKYVTKANLRETGRRGMDSIDEAQDRDHWWSVVTCSGTYGFNKVWKNS